MRMRNILFSTQGRINRREYWLKGLLPLFGFALAFNVGIRLLGQTEAFADPMAVFSLTILVGIAFLNRYQGGMCISGS